MSRRAPQKYKRSLSPAGNGYREDSCAVTRRSGRFGSIENGYFQCENAIVTAQINCAYAFAAGVCSRSRQSNFKRQPLGDEEALRMATASLVKLLWRMR